MEIEREQVQKYRRKQEHRKRILRYGFIEMLDHLMFNYLTIVRNPP